MKKLIIYGKNENTQNVYYYFKNYTNYDIVGFTIDKEYIDEEYICGLPIVPFENIQNIFTSDKHDIFIGIGYANMNKIRKRKIEESKEKGYKLAKFIHPSCYIDKNAIVEDNCFLFENVTLSKCACIKEGSIIQASATVCHDSIINKNCYISTNATICGNVTIKENCFIGAGAIIRNNITIEKDCLIGAGVTILENTKEKQVYKTPNSILLNIQSDKINHI